MNLVFLIEVYASPNIAVEYWDFVSVNVESVISIRDLPTLVTKPLCNIELLLN